MNEVYSLSILLILNFFGVEALPKDIWMKYILLWKSGGVEPFKYLGESQNIFIKNKCPFRNCIVTDDKGYFQNIQDFDIILFNAPNLNTYDSLPSTRAEYQRYVFVSSRSAVDYPVPAGYDKVFNWTWTYRLDSDVIYSYLTVKNKKGEVVGPTRDIRWIHTHEMKKPNKFVKRKLRNKKTAVAWIKTNCYTGFQGNDFVLQLKNELSLYNLTIDIYGHCPGVSLHCSIKVNAEDGCEAKLQKDYYFYLVVEDAICEDYVTDKLLLALKNYAVPVVYGGANYRRYGI